MPHHVQPRLFGARAVEQVEHHVGGEPGGADTQAGEAQRVRRTSAHRRAEHRAEPGAGVDDTAPAVREAHVGQLPEGLGDVLGQDPVRGAPVGQRGVDPTAEVVDGVVPAPQDAVVGGEPVGVELVARVRDARPVAPAHGGQLLGGQRLRRQDVVVHRDRLEAQRASSGRNAFAASTTCAAGTVPDAVCTRTRPPSTVTSSTRVPSAICTPNDSAARASPHASRAGSTRAQPSRSTRPARYVGGLAQEQWQDTVFRTR